MQRLWSVLLLAAGLVAATAADARQRGSDISHGDGGNRGGNGQSKDSRTISDFGSKGKAQKEKEVASEPEPTTATTETQGGVTYDLDVEDATVGTEATTPTADYDLEVAPTADWDYWAREAGIIE